MPVNVCVCKRLVGSVCIKCILILHVRVLRRRTARCTCNSTVHACTIYYITCGVVVYNCFTVNGVHAIAAYIRIGKAVGYKQWEGAGVMTGKSITENDKHI